MNLQWDKELFHFINSTIANPLFDWLMPAITDLHKESWFVYFALPCLLAFWFYKQRLKALPYFLTLILCISCSDLLVYRILKPHFKRERPPATEQQIILRTDRYAGYSLPSNHASNNFAAATFLSYCYPALSPIFLGVAGIISFSRIYVGVHYPFDIITGGLLGALIGLIFFKLLLYLKSKRQ